MANEIEYEDPALTGQTLYMTLTVTAGADSGKSWNPANNAYEAYTTTRDTWDIAGSEVGTTGRFTFSLPSNANSHGKRLRAKIYQDANDDGTPDHEDDTLLAYEDGYWDGSTWTADFGDLVSLLANEGITVTDFDDEPVPAERTWVAIEQASGGLVGDRTLRMRQGTTPTFAIDFRNDLSVNGRVVSVAAPEILSGDSDGLSFGTRGRRGSQAKIRITGDTVGSYTIGVTVTYHNLDTQKCVVRLEVVS